MWLSLICTNCSSPLAAAAPRSSRPPELNVRLRLKDFRTPPLITHRVPVPAHAMHFRNPRRSTPSWLWSIKSSSCFLSLMVLLVSAGYDGWPLAHRLHFGRPRHQRVYSRRSEESCERFHGTRD